MKKVCLLCWMLIDFLADTNAQPVAVTLKAAIAALERDPQLRHGLLGFYVMDAKTGKPVFEKNAAVGLAPASTQKIITSAAAFELLGKEYRYTTTVEYNGKIQDGILKGDFFIMGSGDPTLGSWRFRDTKEEKVLQKILYTLKQNKINRIEGSIYMDESGFSIQTVPDGWIWQDIGNYYGAGSWGLNWRENQYDLVLKPGLKIGDTTKIVSTNTRQPLFSLTNTITTAAKESGDNGYIYLSPYSVLGFTTGTIPAGENFIIAGAMPNPPAQLGDQLKEVLGTNGIIVSQGFKFQINKFSSNQGWSKPESIFDSIISPTLDSINYWFLKKSINLYGEALIKTIAKENAGFGSTEKGISVIKDFWSKQEIESSAINIVDGCGLSPQNRVTTHALVKILQYAKSRSWFHSFYEALPVYNGMKMKSGSINGARSFAGYHRSGAGKEYIFAIIVNNYTGLPGNMVKKMYTVLDLLK